MRLAMYFIFSISIFITTYTFFKVIKKIKKEKYINKLIENLNNSYKKRLEEQEEEQEAVKEKVKFINKIDNLINKSNIREKIPFLTSEMFIAAVMLISFTLAITFYATYNTFLLTIVVFVVTIISSILALKLAARITYDKIDQQVLTYINTMNNLCNTNDDIVIIMKKTIPYLKEPLKGYTEKFVFQVEKGIPINIAFKNFENKIESKRFKQLLKNLEISSKYATNYEKVLVKSKIIMKKYFEQKNIRAKAIKDGRIAMASIGIIGFFTIQIVTSFTPGLKEALFNTTLGKIIVGYFVILVITVIYQMLTVDKVNY